MERWAVAVPLKTARLGSAFCQMNQASMVSPANVVSQNHVTDPNLGDDELKAEYEARAASFDPTEYWQSLQNNLQHVAEAGRQQTQDNAHRKSFDDVWSTYEELNKHENGAEDQKLPAEAQSFTPMELDTEPATHEPYNPWEGDEMAKQLGETLDAFLARLPPSTTTLESGPWIWIANPFSPQRPLQVDVAGFKTSGNELLQDHLDRKANVEAQNPGKPPGAITRLLQTDREWLERSIVDLAKSKGMMNGKWMLFPFLDMVDEIWRKVAKATMEGTLGCAAKVAADDGSGSQRPICIYTKDFTDEEDVRRVLKKIQDLQLVKSEQGIYYKCDAYTYLNIMSGNDFKLKASMYSSKEISEDKSAKKR